MKVKVRYVEVLEGIREVEGDSLEAITKQVEAAQENAGNVEIKPFETVSMYAELIVDEVVVQVVSFC